MPTPPPNSGQRLLILPETGLALPWLRAAATGEPETAILCPETDADAVRTLLPGPAVHCFSGGNFVAARPDIGHWRRWFREAAPNETLLVRNMDNAWGYEAYETALRLCSVLRFDILTRDGREPRELPPLPAPDSVRSLLLKACGGIGNLVLATPLLRAGLRAGWKAAFCPVNDGNGQGAGALFKDAELDGPTILTPDEARSFRADLYLNIEARSLLAPEDCFHSPYRMGETGHEPTWAARFFENVTGHSADPAETFVGGLHREIPERLRGRVVVCPGSKPGWDSKRWPHFDALLRRLERPVVLCRPADLDAYRKLPFLTPITAPNAEFVTDLDLPGMAALLRAARAVVANDCGPAHVAAATGAPTLVLFGPSSLVKNRHERPNVKILTKNLSCQPCQGAAAGPGRLGPGRYSCTDGFRCLADLTPDRVLFELATMYDGDFA